MADLLSFLFKKYEQVINGVQPLVPALWTGDPATPGLKPIEQCFPDSEAIRCRVQDLITHTVSKEGLTCSNRKVINNPKPLQDLISPKAAALTCRLVRDYNGEYAPCIAAVLGGGSCQIVPALKPSSMKATIAEVDGGKRKAFAFTGCPEGDAKAEAAATAWISEKLTKSTISGAYHEAELKKAAMLGTRLFEAADLGFTTRDVPNPTSMNSLHQYWRANDIPRRFYSKVSEWAPDKKRRTHWASSIYHEAPVVERNKPSATVSQHSAPVSDVATVKPQPPIVFVLWLRLQPPKDHSHNMGQDLLREIISALSHVCQHVYPTKTTYMFLLFGDRGAVNVGDYPFHGAASRGGASGANPVPEFILDTFLKEWTGPAPHVIARDFRDLYNSQYFQTPRLEDYEFTPAGKKADEIRKEYADYRKTHARKAPYSYWEQYSFFQFIDANTHPRFIIGAESGNMDGFGYCGIPVISIDVEDEAAVDESIVTDRIGQYCLLTPLWNLLNYHRGKHVETFRSHLYGAILMYTKYAGGLHETKSPVKVPKIDRMKWQEEKDALATLLQTATSSSNVIEESLKASYDVVDVLGDGNCLFRALSRARTPTEDRHLLYRQQAVRYASLFFDEAMLTAGSGCGSADDYEGTMKTAAINAEDTTRYGGFVEIEAYALREGITIEVYSEGLEKPIVSNEGGSETIRILYINRNHYKAIVPRN